MEISTIFPTLVHEYQILASSFNLLHFYAFGKENIIFITRMHHIYMGFVDEFHLDIRIICI